MGIWIAQWDRRKIFLPGYSLHWAFFHEMGKDPKWTWSCYCGNWSGLMTKWHSSPSWWGFGAAWVSPGVDWYRGTRSQEGRTVFYPVVVWGRRDTGRGGDRRDWPCMAPFPPSVLIPGFTTLFSNIFFHQILFVGDKNARCGRGQWGRRVWGWLQRQERGGQRESTYRERNTGKSSKFLFILAQQYLQHGLACLLLLNKYCDSSNPSEQGRNQNLDFHWGQTVMGTL